MTTAKLRQHWFFLAAPIILALDVFVGLSARGDIDLLIESGLLFDFVVLVPCLYWLCYRRNGRAAIIKAAALACLGIWLALKLIPEPERQLLNYVEPLRYVGLAALIWLELVVVAAIYRSVFKGATTEEAAQASQDLPPWVARLLAWEARLWLRAWQWIQRIAGRR